MMEKENQIHLIGQAKVKRKSLLKRRVYAFTMDLLAITFINKALIFSYISFVKENFYHLPTGLITELAFKLQRTEIISLSMVFCSYFFLTYYLFKGQSPGKVVFNLRVKKFHSSEESLDVIDCFARSLGYFVSYLLGFVPFAISFFRKDQKGLPDFISSTYVMALEDEIAIEEQLDQGYEEQTMLTFPEDPISARISKESA